MPILQGDIKLVASQVMDDVPEGGGAPTATVIVDGASNAIFPDVSELDRAGCRINLRKLHVHVQTADRDTYMGANIIVAEPPADPNVAVTLFTTKETFDRRSQAQSSVEAYLNKGPEWAGFLYENHIAGQRVIQLFQRPSDVIPNVGQTLVLTHNEGQPTQKEQYVRATRVSVVTRTFTDLQGDYQANIVTVDLSDALRADMPGSPASRYFQRADNGTKVRDTVVADAGSYTGVVPLRQAVLIGDTTVRAASIYTQLVPSSRTETIALDQRPAAQRTLTLATSPREITVGAAPHTTRIKVGQENRGSSWVNMLKPFPAPNSLTISYMALGTWYTVTDDGAGKLTGSGVGTVNYGNGSVALTLPVLPDAGSAIIYTWGEKSAYTNRSGQAGFRAPEYALKLDHTCIKPGTLVIKWLSGAVLRTATDNGAGALTGGDATGEINYASGDLFIRPLHMPDAGAQFSIDYEWATVTTKSVTVSPDAGGFANIVLDTVPAAGSVTVEWITVRNVSSSSGGSSSGTAAGKQSGSSVSTVEPKTTYVSSNRPDSAPPPVALTRVPVSGWDEVMSPYMAPGGTLVSTGEPVYIRVKSEFSPTGYTYPVPDASDVTWSNMEWMNGTKTIGGVTYERWGYEQPLSSA